MKFEHLENDAKASLDAHKDGEKKPITVKAFHGTTHDFDVFDSSLKGNKEGAFGAMSYFTSSFEDACHGYANLGESELASRIEKEYLRQNATTDEARSAIKSKLQGQSPQVLEVEIDLKKPFHIDGKSPLFDGGLEWTKDGEVSFRDGSITQDDNLVFPDLGRRIQNARDEVAQELGYDTEEDMEIESYDEHMDAFGDLEDAEEAVVERRWGRVSRAVEKATRESGFGDGQEAAEKVRRAFPFLQHVGQNAFYHGLMKVGAEFEQEPDVSGQAVFASEVIKNLGYDSIILHDAQARWPHLNMAEGTKHVHVFRGNEAEQVKIVNRHPVEQEQVKTAEVLEGVRVQEMTDVARSGQSLRASGQFSKEDLAAFAEVHAGLDEKNRFADLPTEFRAELAGAQLHAQSQQQDLSDANSAFEQVRAHWSKTRPGLDMPDLGVMDAKTYEHLGRDIMQHKDAMSPDEFHKVAVTVFSGEAAKASVEVAAKQHAGEIASSRDPVGVALEKVADLRTQGDKKNIRLKAAASVFQTLSEGGDLRVHETLLRTAGALRVAATQSGTDANVMATAFGVRKGLEESNPFKERQTEKKKETAIER